MQHITNKHVDHPNSLFQKCAHGEIEKRKCIKVGKSEMKLICCMPTVHFIYHLYSIVILRKN